jgi:DNA-binding transcriptional MerR regulator
MGSHHPIRKIVAPEPVVVPDKLYFRIGDVARLCDVPAYVLRFWETEFPQLKPNKGGTGQRLYRKKDVETALRIKSLLYDQGYTIPGARLAFKSDAPVEPLAVVPLPTPSSLSPAIVEDAFELDLGTQIRRDAQQRDRISALRADLESLAALLGRPAASVPAEPAPPAMPRPIRPRLVLEPKPEPRPIPAIHLNQGDLFASE